MATTKGIPFKQFIETVMSRDPELKREVLKELERIRKEEEGNGN
jgi:hypothetical protein